MNMVLASAMFWGAYEILLDVTGSPWGALGGPLALLWTPRLMGYIPMNPRDGAFAVFFFIGLVGIYFWGDPTRSESKRGWLSVLGLGLLIGMAQSARLVGFDPLSPVGTLWDVLHIEGNGDRGPGTTRGLQKVHMDGVVGGGRGSPFHGFDLALHPCRFFPSLRRTPGRVGSFPVHGASPLHGP